MSIENKSMSRNAFLPDYRVMTLWKSRIGSIFGIVRAGETDHREVASLAEQISADYHGRFLIELLQNASDQAMRAQLTNGVVTIIRTDKSVFVANPGLPFDEKGLRSITSLGLSTKDPQQEIGNKGIGFKSVFQVSSSPEIYSAPSPAEPFDADNSLRFSLSLAPFDSIEHEQMAHDVIADVIHPQAQDENNGPSGSSAITLDALFEELKFAAPFKFPLPLDKDHLAHRLEEAGVVFGGQTLVVLPLRKDGNTNEIVTSALDELWQELGAAILFLPAISTIEIYDHVRGFHTTIQRKTLGGVIEVSGAGYIHTVRTEVSTDGGLAGRNWRVISRMYGEPDCVSNEQATLESQQLNTAAQRLPGKNWDKVDASPIDVAIPLSSKEQTEDTLLLGARGRICIGLPTKDATGTPAWVNAHFSGTISRKGTDLDGCEYNHILFQEAVRLHAAILDCLKKDPVRRHRRVVTLLFQRDRGPLADAVFAGDVARSEVILSVDGERFLAPKNVTLLTPSDFEMLPELLPDLRQADDYGFCIMDSALQKHARTVLEDLVATHQRQQCYSSLYLDRSEKVGMSLIESAAARRRADGPAFWERFLVWLLDRFDAKDLTDQAIMPVGSTGIAKPLSRVFLPPAISLSSTQKDDEDEEVGEIPDNLQVALKILDASSLSIRNPGTRDLTKVASRLEEESLVRRPRLDILINDAIGPLMQSLTDDGDDQSVICSLLVQAVQWIWKLSDTGRERLRKDALRVPVMSDDRWVWVEPSSVYFGSGWIDDTTDALLDAAYGFDPLKRLVPWDDFVKEVRIDTCDRDAWIGALESLGVSATPKIKRPDSRSRFAPLESWNMQELQIVEGVVCPLPEAQPYWRAYLETTRKRGAETRSGQKFDFRSVTWIDSLERDASREPIVELMLLSPSKYEAERTTILERYQRRDQNRSTVDSLWIHAIRENQWKVIPTQNGWVSPQSAWLLDDDQRKLAKQRLRLLNQVDDQCAKGTALLFALGVTSLATATVPRLLTALDSLAVTSSTFDADERLNARSLAEDLFKYLQLTYSDAPVPLPQLRNIRLPLFKQQTVIDVPGTGLVKAYFNDDPTRAAFIYDFNNSYVWPLQPRYPYRDLVAEIRKQLGEESVLFTSRVPIESGFIPDLSIPEVPLLDWITDQWPNHNVISDLACLIAYSGRETKPSGDEFRRTWNRFKKAGIRVGLFPSEAPKPYFYDQQTSLLQVSGELSKYERVEATWMLVDQSYRDTWAAYARDLARNRAREFLAERSITAAHRENVEAEIGLTSAERFRHMKSAFFSTWLKQFGDQPVELFEAEWKQNAGLVKRLCEWVKLPELEDVVAAGLVLSEEKVSVNILEAADIAIVDWQTDRVRLGLSKLAFSDTARAWKASLWQLIGVLKVSAARSGRVILADARSLVELTAVCEVPSHIKYLPAKAVDVKSAILGMVKHVMQEQDESSTQRFLLDRLTAVEKAEGGFYSLPDVPRRDVAVYVDDDEVKRTCDAKARLEVFSQVCDALAQYQGESFDPSILSTDARVVTLSSGWWANCYSIIPVIQNVLQKNLPLTSRRLSEERAFRDPAPKTDLMVRFEELKDVRPPTRHAVARKVELFGSEHREDQVLDDLSLGSTGEIGNFLRAAMQTQLRSTMKTGTRGKVQIPVSKSGQGGRGRGSGGEGKEYERQLTGRIGEACFYEWGLVHLPEFDERAWRSECREFYGLDGAGVDSLGFDFSYRDQSGVLTGRNDKPMCKIEVKSSTGDGSESFLITAKEWETARACNSNDDEEYVIVRIAHVRSAPVITDIICDPFELYRKGQIDFITKDMRMFVGSRIEKSVE